MIRFIHNLRSVQLLNSTTDFHTLFCDDKQYKDQNHRTIRQNFEVDSIKLLVNI